MPVLAVPHARLVRFLQAGLLNSLVGYGLYAGAVAIGMDVFVAQIVATILAVAFNYVSYGRYVFNDARPSPWRFVLSYGFTYLVSVSALAVAALLVRSPYLAGLLAMSATAAVNFLVLRHWVFIRRATGIVDDHAMKRRASCG